jgi:hypothetical protein
MSNAAEALDRWTRLEQLQEMYPVFEEFLAEGIEELMGFTCTDVQLDIGNYLQYGPKYRMIQAQRSQAKTTITSFYAVWRLIHDPAEIILIFSAGGDMANEISNGIIDIIGDWDILECLRPAADDRQSTKAYDVHKQLKGYNKSPSVACMGITANMQGRRASVLIADDIESSKNALTETQRDLLLHKSRDFTSINQKGDIIYLGTPQSTDSVYNTLPGRGFDIRIWPGRFPTEKEEKNYGTHLAPFIKNMMDENPELRTGAGVLADRGHAVDPVLVPEEILVAKEIDQGPAYFQLQHMLDTALMDAARYPLREKHAIFANLSEDQTSVGYLWQPTNDTRVTLGVGSENYEFHYAAKVEDEQLPYTGRMMFIDTAGGGQNAGAKGADEMVGVVTYFLNGMVFFMDMEAFVPNPDEAEGEYRKLASLAYKHRVNHIEIERNFGGEMLASAIKKEINLYYEEMEKSDPAAHKAHMEIAKAKGGPSIETSWAAGQKELRIIDTLEPLMRRHQLIINVDMIEKDAHLSRFYPAERKRIYSLWHQMRKITRDKASLSHDDRLDALAGACGYWAESVVQDERKMAERKLDKEVDDIMAEWGAPGIKKGGRGHKRRHGSLARCKAIR